MPFLRKIFISSLLFLAILQFGFAKVSASVDRTTIGAGESFTLTLHLDNFNQKPDLVPLGKSFTVYNASTSSKKSIVNGKTTSSYDMIITLMPIESGNVVIPALTVGSEKTNTITLNVAKEVPNNVKTQYSDVFVTGTLSPKISYVNQPVLYTIKIYYATPLMSLELKPFEIKDTDIRETGHNSRYTKVVNGRTYDVIEQSFLMIPEITGEIFIPAIVFQLQVAPSFGMSGPKTIYSSTKAMYLKVLPIPSDVSIDDWLPATAVELKDKWSKDTGFRTGELVTRTVTIKADGVLGSDLPKLKFKSTDQFNVYPEPPELNDTEVNGHVVGTATYKIGYVPTKQGFMNVPDLNVSWYDTRIHKSKIETIKSKTYTVEEGQRAIQVVSSESASPQSIVQTVEKIVVDDKWKKIAIIFIALWAVTLLMLIIIVFQKRSPSAAIDKKPKEKGTKKTKGLQAIKKACDTKDMFMLKEAVLAWAEERYKIQLFSLLDISTYNQSLTAIMYKLDSALYSGDKFEAFDDLYNQIALANKKDKKTKKSDTIKGLYD